MSLLAKIGQAVVKGIGIVSGFLPLFAPTTVSGSNVAHITDDLTKIAGSIQTVEAVFAAISDPAAKTGAQKLQSASKLVQQVVAQAEFVVGKKVGNEALFVQGCQKLTDGVVDVLNSLEG